MSWTSPNKTWVAGEVPTAGDFNTYIRDQLDAILQVGPTGPAPWSPVLKAATTNPALGSGSSASGAYIRIGEFVYANAIFIFGSSGVSAGSGAYHVDLPVAADSAHRASGTGFNGEPIGTAFCRDSGTGTNNIVVFPQVAAGAAAVRFHYDGGNTVSNSLPFTWAANDQFMITLCYWAG